MNALWKNNKVAEELLEVLERNKRLQNLHESVDAAFKAKTLNQ